MNTSDILESLNMAAGSKRGIPNLLLLQIDEALHERDMFRARLEQSREELFTVHSENEKLAVDYGKAMNSCAEWMTIAANRQVVVIKLQDENDELRAEVERLLKLLEAVVNPDEDIDSVYSKILEVTQ